METREVRETKGMAVPTRDLAAMIYARMVGNAVVLTDASVTMKTSADNLAKLSFKLAQAFEKVEGEVNAEFLPKNVGYKVEADDIAKWTK
jgi:hypothetical protein